MPAVAKAQIKNLSAQYGSARISVPDRPEAPAFLANALDENRADDDYIAAFLAGHHQRDSLPSQASTAGLGSVLGRFSSRFGPSTDSFVEPVATRVPDEDKYHIFDGDGMVHSVEFSAGKASYRNKFVDSAGLREEREKGHWIFPGLNMYGELIAKGEMPKSKNTGNTAMVFHQGKLFGLMEGGTPYELSLPSLETVGEHDFDGTLTHNFTAHPKVDAQTGEMMTFGYSPFPP